MGDLGRGAMTGRRIPSAAFVVALCGTSLARAADVPADPTNYQSALGALKPGDTLKLAAGDYANGMNVFDLNGADGTPIVIEGPGSGSVARFLGKSGKNTVDIKNSSFITIKNLVFDGQGIQDIDAIKAGGLATDWAHHITIENCTITNHDGGESNQQIVGISTKIVTWDWVIRGNVIDGAGTGAYLGNSDGTRAFIGGIIEGNLFRKTLGYGMQIKHQLDRGQADVPQVPTDPRVTIIRHNVFIKRDLPSPDGVRPNLLVDGFPDSGPGSSDHVEIYGNLFFHNDGDALFQGNGRLHIHDNIFVDSKNAAIRLVDHSGKTVKEALIYNNTIYGTATGISIGNAPSEKSWIAGNAIFSAQPMSGAIGALDNVEAGVAEAAQYVVNPSLTLGQMDFYPKAGSALKAAAIDSTDANADTDFARDFNGTQKDFTYRGAYQGEGTNPGWALADEKKTLGASTGGSGGAATTGGTTSSGGTPSSGGAKATGGSKASATSDDDGGCGCRIPSKRGPAPIALFLLAIAASACLRRK